MTLRHTRTPRTQLAIAPFDEQFARTVQTWRYPAALQRYDFSDDPFERQWLCHPSHGCWQITDQQQQPFGFAVIGQHAQVAGGRYHGVAIDVLVGIRPDLLDQQHGYDLAACVVTHTHQIHPTVPIRVSVPSFHHRALTLWQRFGLFPEYAFMAADSTPHVVLIEQPHLY
jgi:hypothetical protein